MHTVAQDSLLDESDFLAELSSLEHGMAVKPRPLSEPTEMPSPVRMFPPGKFVDEPQSYAAIVEDAEGDQGNDAPVLGRLAAVGMFVLMMGVGAAGAALVFHDQVARILTSLRI
jgi:hypothetical protein